jgi:hypothetical protein
VDVVCVNDLDRKQKFTSIVMGTLGGEWNDDLLESKLKGIHSSNGSLSKGMEQILCQFFTD